MSKEIVLIKIYFTDNTLLELEFKENKVNKKEWR